MASSALLPFLRPSPLPRQSFIRSFIRTISTSPRFRQEAASLLTSSSPSKGDPERQIPPPVQKPRPSRPQPQAEPLSQQKRQRQLAHLQLQPLLPQKPHLQQKPQPEILHYHISRTASNELRVYHTTKRGGNLKETIVKGITGDVVALREDMIRMLGLEELHIRINQLTNSLILKGFKKPEVTKFFVERQF
ncbi:hypothetical protein MMC14_003403 [Varicellaria rhodocarpa]|nr:hypothetical protein [Varicellaria rhodocarpa]